MKYPTLYRVTNYTTLEAKELFAYSTTGAQTAADYAPTDKIEVSEVLTPEGYRIYRLEDIPKGSYFCRCKGYGGLATNKTIWVKGEYNHSARQYEVYKFEDINHTSLRNGTCYVTIDMTF